MNDKSILTELLPWAPIIGTLGGALLAGLIALGINLINKKSEERRHIRELMLKTAMEYFKAACDTAAKTGGSVPPLEAFIVHVIKTSEVLIDTKITKDNVVQKLKEAHAVSKEVEIFLIEEDAAEKAKQKNAKKAI